MSKCHVFFCVATALCLTGCSKPSTTANERTVSAAAVESTRAAHLAAEAPEGAIEIGEFRSLLVRQSTDAPDESAEGNDESAESPSEVNDMVLSTPMTPVVLTGRVGGTEIAGSAFEGDFPWDPGKAQFVISDPNFTPSDSSHGHEHEDPDHDCPFCNKAKNETAKSMAYVQLLDEKGDIIKIDARELFDLTGDEVVVIKGQGRLTVGTMIVQAEKVYVER